MEPSIRGLKTTWPRQLYKPSFPVLLLSLILGLCIAVSAADIFVPVFWARRPLVVFAFLVAATMLPTLLLPATVRKSLRLAAATTTPVARGTWIFIAAALTVSAALVLGGAASHQLSLQSTGSASPLQPANYPLTAHSVDFAFVFVFAVFLGLVHGDLIGKRLNAEERVYVSLFFLGLCFLGIYAANNLLPAINTSTNQWRLNFNLPHGFTPITPVGDDFRRGIYLPAQELLSGSALYPGPKGFENWYPPLVALMGLPYLLLSQDQSYILHVVLLVIANVFSLALAALLVRDPAMGQSDPQAIHANTIHLTTFLLVAFNLLSSYAFMFSFERGNIDIFAMLFGLASIWVVLKHPGRIWLQVILLSIAVHIKVYPVFLFAILFFVNGFRILLPSVLVNTAFLFVLGPANAAGFVYTILRYYQSQVTTYNHSGYAFAALLTRDFPGTAPGLPALQIIFTCIPLVIWIIAWRVLTRFKSKKAAILAGLMITVPLMAVFPNVSNDYQLVIISSATLILLSRSLIKMTVHQDRSDFLQLLVIALLTLIIGRSDALMGSSLGIIQDKYLWIVLLQLVMLVSIFQQLADERLATSRGADPLQTPPTPGNSPAA